jgi:hypothetical protein
LEEEDAAQAVLGLAAGNLDERGMLFSFGPMLRERNVACEKR